MLMKLRAVLASPNHNSSDDCGLGQKGCKFASYFKQISKENIVQILQAIDGRAYRGLVIISYPSINGLDR